MINEDEIIINIFRKKELNMGYLNNLYRKVKSLFQN
jgi:hypothetical protein